MDDPKIDELCQRIYKNHRQAIELIVERVGTGSMRLLAIAENVICEKDDWLVVRRTSSHLRFVPKGWIDLLPPIGKEATVSHRLWLNLGFGLKSSRLICHFAVRPTTDVEVRRKVIDRLIEQHEEFGFTNFVKDGQQIGSHYTQLGQETVAMWKDDEEMDDETIADLVRKKLDQLATRLAGVPDALRPIIEEWEASR